MSDSREREAPAAGGQGASYAAKTVRNVAWLGGSQFLRQGISIGTTVVLARFLATDDYGVFAMTLFVNEVAQLLVNFGIGAAIIQRKDVDQTLLSTCFWANLAISAVVALGVVLVSPAAALHFKQPLVQQLLLASALNICVGGLMVVPQALLSRRLAFDQIALSGTVASLCGAGAALALALSGAGVWALVFQPLIGTVVNLALLARKARWLPNLRFQLDSLRGIARFSVNLLIDSVVSHLTRNLHQLIVAPIAGAAAMGLLAMASMVAWLPVAQFTQVAVRAIYPVFSKLQDEGDRFFSALLKTASMVAALTFPLLVGLAVLAVDVVPLLLGAQWVDAAPLVSVLCGLCLVQSVAGLAGGAMLAQGRAKVSMLVSLVGFVGVGASLWLARNSGIFWVTVVIACTQSAMSLLMLHLVLNRVEGGWPAMLRAMVRPGAAAFVMGLAIWTMQPLLALYSPILRLAALILLGAGVYIAMSLLCNRAMVVEMFKLVASRRAKAAPSK